MFKFQSQNIFRQSQGFLKNFGFGYAFRRSGGGSVFSSAIFGKIYFLLFVLLLSGCGLEKKLAQMNRDVPFDVQIAQDQFYEGQDTSIQISLLKTYPEEKTLNWRIEDENGNLASASAFAESSGEITLNGNEPANFSITSVSGAAGGEVGKTYYLVIASNGLEKRFNLNLMNAGTASIVITSTDNLGYVNQANQSSYTVSGTCSDEGGSVSLKVSSGAGELTQSTTCVSLAWSVTLDYSSLSDGVVSLNAKHVTHTSAQATAALAIQKDTLNPTLSIDLPAAMSYINVSNVASFTLSGTCSEDTKSVALTFSSSGGGSPVTSSTACASSAWSKSLDLSALAQGTITVQASHSDSAGNSVLTSSTFIKDALAPNLVFLTPANGAYVKNPSPTLTGSCEDGLSIVISGSGVSSPASATCASSSFSVAVTLTAGDGSKVVTLTQTDPAGNTTTQTHAITLDTLAPALSFTSTLVQDQTTNTNTVTFSGSCEAGVSISVGGGSDSSSTTCTAGAWSYTTSSQSTDALRTYTFDQIDLAGNPSTITGTWLRDATLPSVTLTSLTGGEFVKGGASTNITWNASDVNITSTPITLEYSTNGGTSWTAIASDIANSGSYAWSVPAINASSVKVKVTAKDVVNTNSDQSATNFVIDSSNPVVSLTALNGGQVLKGGATQNITWTASDANLTSTPISLDYTQDGTTWVSIATGLTNSGTYPWSVPLLDGTTFKVRVTATDQVSNSASALSTAPFSIDSTNPSVTLTSMTGGQTIGNSGSVHAITWSASDAHMTATSMALFYSDDSGVSWTQIASNLSNSGTYSWSVSLADGTHYRVKVTATDSVGNVGESSSSSDFTITSQAPNLTQTTVTSPFVSNAATTVTFGGACDLSATMVDTTVTISGAQSATTTCTGTAPTGTWSWTTSSQSTDASRSYSFAQTNTYGVTSTVNATWIRDTVAPQVSVVMVNDGEAYLHTTIGAIQVTASDAAYSTGLQVRVATAAGSSANCQSLYADDSWQNQINPTMTYVANFPDGDGIKKACAWAKDAAGNVSVISPNTGTAGVDMDTIGFSSAAPPQITSFSVTNNSDGSQSYSAGDLVKISWSVTDSLGLDNNPIKLEYTTDNVTWNTFEAGYGSLSGNPTSYSSDYYGFNAPASSYFRIRITATNVTGTNSVAVISASQNTGNWSVYAGTTDRGIGGNARSALFYKYSYFKHFAFNPANGDLYGLDQLSSGGGILKIDARTGIVSKFISPGATNLPDNGTLPANPTISTSWVLIAFDHSNKMYIMISSASRTLSSSQIYQIDLTTNYVRKYLGSSSALAYDNTATPSTVFVQANDFTFDESNTMYFTTSCLAGTTWDYAHVNGRLMKVTQNADGTPGTVSVVAGDCTQTSPVSGTLATNTGFSSYGDGLYTSLIAWNNGDAIYYSDPSQGVYKIINGVAYNTALPKTRFMAYSPFSHKIYLNGDATTYGDIREYSPDESSSANEALTATIVQGGGTGSCNEEGTNASATCMNFYGGMIFDPQGKLYFDVGTGSSPTRLAYVNSENKISVMAGTLPFYGDGLDKSVARGTFGGLYYKQSSEPNQSAFPAGLYFTEQTGFVIGYIDDVTGKVQILGGNQTGTYPNAWPTGTAFSKDISLGAGGGTYGKKITFDSQGLPWFTYGVYNRGAVVASLDSSGNMVLRQNGSTYWDLATIGSDPVNTKMQYYGGESNLTLKASSLFVLGGTVYTTITRTDPVLRILDFAASKISQIMGNGGSTSSPDTVTAGPLTGLDINSVCLNSGCKAQFIENNAALTTDDLLYFTEGKLFRVISNPTTPSNSLLTTVFTASTTISNFIISRDQTQVFYTMSGGLYCYPLTAAGNKSWCNSTKLGPTTGMNLIGTGPNQFAWKDDQTLLISNYAGEIYQYNVPQVP